ncbi:MAG: DUF4126 domain-containing protein [Gemmataceae bacterium]|nr:hypothetical protein [Gemmata sp.]MDW8195986.1 DUF4126 domain-containing protein [Gemmataceae bacterium]
MYDETLSIDIGDFPDRVCSGERIIVRVTIRNASHGRSTELRSLESRKPQVAQIESELFERDIILGPGEEYHCDVAVRFLREGTFPAPHFALNAGRDPHDRIIDFPTPDITVVPSLNRELRVTIEPICTYEHVGTKLDVHVEHIGTHRLTDFHLRLGPREKIRSGYVEQKRPEFKPGEVLRFTVVVDAEELALTAEASAGSQMTGPVTWRLPVQTISSAATTAPYRFLEPRKLSDADIELRSINENATLVPFYRGAFIVTTGQKYRLVIRPHHPHVEDVHFLSHRGVAEVERLPVRDGTWEFLLQLVSNSKWSTTSVLHYAVTTSDGPQQGELVLLIRPTLKGQWTLAATLGAAVTVKGLAGIAPALANPEGFWKSLVAAPENLGSLLNVVAAVSIPLIWIGIWSINALVETLQD